MSNAFFIFCLVALLVIALLAILILRQKNRCIWQKLWDLQHDLRTTASSISNEFESAFKQLAKSRFSGRSRLPMLMPSQHGEDVLLWNFFDRKTEGYFVEVGAFDGVTFSNSYFFEAIGWSGTLVEAVPDFAERARLSRPNSKIINKAVGGPGTKQVIMKIAQGSEEFVGAFSFVGKDQDDRAGKRIRSRGGRIKEEIVECMTLDEILGDLPFAIDFISIDVEGCELDVLEHFSLDKYVPAVLVIEDNSHGTDRRVSERLGSSGYVERFRRGPNVFYTKRDDCRQFTWV